MKKEFIKINNTIQDYYSHKKEQHLIKAYLLMKIKDLMKEQGFNTKMKSTEKISFYNQKKDIEIKICFEKRKEIFV